MHALAERVNIARKCKGEETNPWVRSLAHSGCVYQPVKVSSRQLPKPHFFKWGRVHDYCVPRSCDVTAIFQWKAK